MKIALLGATSQIAKDLVLTFGTKNDHEIVLYARRTFVVTDWLSSVGLGSSFLVRELASFNTEERFDAIINFIGVGDPAKSITMGASIIETTLKYDSLVLEYLKQNPKCRYIFISSGAAYGLNFDVPVDENSKALIPINNLQLNDWYGIAKLHTECRHRSLVKQSIIDIRIFNYFSYTQDMEARFLITDIVRAIRDKTVFKTSANNIMRDFIGAEDFYQLVMAILTAEPDNLVIDCYSKSPVDKLTLLVTMQKRFGLKYELKEKNNEYNDISNKINYYSLNRMASKFNYEPKLTSLERIINEISLLNRAGYFKNG
jgi:nucleoside-diphosphate-sugar epimerase